MFDLTHSKNIDNNDADIIEYLSTSFKQFITKVQRIYTDATDYDFEQPDISIDRLRILTYDLIYLINLKMSDIE